ncbi:MAG: hypothetical protein NVS9B15_16780 [Acidobacteriaceae bacterium]
MQQKGQPLSGAMVLLIPEKGVKQKDLLRRDESDSDGTFTLRGVPEGKYTVVAIRDGWHVRWADPEVLRPYLAAGVPVQVVGSSTRQVAVEAK